MSIELLRVDERLIHGQVVIGWGRQLRPRRYLVVDDVLADSAWEQELYLLAVEGDAEVRFLGVAEARAQLDEMLDDEIPTVMLTRDVQTMGRLAEGGGLRGRRVNLGGLHPAAGRRQVRGWLNLGPEDDVWLRRLVDAGAEVSGRDLPDTPPVKLPELLPPS